MTSLYILTQCVQTVTTDGYIPFSQPPLWIKLRNVLFMFDFMSYFYILFTCQFCGLHKMQLYALRWVIWSTQTPRLTALRAWHRSNPACGSLEFRIKSIYAQMLHIYIYIFKSMPGESRLALILTGSCECVCLQLCEWRIAGLITSHVHNNWGTENLLVKKSHFC